MIKKESLSITIDAIRENTVRGEKIVCTSAEGKETAAAEGDALERRRHFLEGDVESTPAERETRLSNTDEEPENDDEGTTSSSSRKRPGLPADMRLRCRRCPTTIIDSGIFQRRHIWVKHVERRNKTRPICAKCPGFRIGRNIGRKSSTRLVNGHFSKEHPNEEDKTVLLIDDNIEAEMGEEFASMLKSFFGVVNKRAPGKRGH